MINTDDIPNTPMLISHTASMFTDAVPRQKNKMEKDEHKHETSTPNVFRHSRSRKLYTPPGSPIADRYRFSF